MPGERIQRRIESLLDEADAPPYFPWIQAGNQWATLGGTDEMRWWADFGSWRMRRQTGEQVAE